MKVTLGMCNEHSLAPAYLGSASPAKTRHGTVMAGRIFSTLGQATVDLNIVRSACGSLASSLAFISGDKVP